jgi:hypothetical protein
MLTDDDVAKLSKSLLREIGPLLDGKPPAVQGTALAYLVAMWLAGHVNLTSQRETAASREELLTLHVEAVRALVPASAKAMGLPH